MPAKRIIILDRNQGGRFGYALWADVPATRQSFYADVNKKSVWLGASVAENGDIAAGRVVEDVNEAALPPGTPIVQIQNFLEQQWADFQTRITNANPWNRYGTFWDGTTWTVGGAT